MIDGRDGKVVDRSHLKKMSNLSNEMKQSYPPNLLVLMKRYAENLIWMNKVTKGEEVLRFLVSLTENRQDAADIHVG